MLHHSVTDTNILVSNLELEDILKILKISSSDAIKIHFVKLKWLTDSNKNGSLCDHTQSTYSIQKATANKTDDRSPSKMFSLANYECQRKTPNRHCNENLTVLFIF